MKKLSLKILVLFSIFFNSQAYALKTDQGSIILSASSEVTYKPNKIKIDFIISSFASSPDASYNIYKKRSDDLLMTLRAIPAISEVYSSGFDLSPKYDYQERTKILQGYDTHGFFVIKADIDAVGTLIDLLAKNNVDSINKIEFSINKADLEDKKSEAANLALKQAIQKAETMLTHLDIHDYKLRNISVSEAVVSTPYFNQNGVLLTKSDTSTVIPGKQTISATVAIEVEYN